MIGNIVMRDDLADSTRAEMYELFSRQFDGVSFEAFSDDLNEKNWALLLRGKGKKLSGFSTIHFYEKTLRDKTYPIVYSGDTVVDVSSWSDSALSYWWMGTIDYLRRRHRKECVYWFLLVSGYRTYRFLPVYSARFFPRFDEPTPASIQELMHELARDRFGVQYDETTGIVRLKTPAILKSELRGIPENRMSDPHVAYFAGRNPEHARGDELVCYAELSESSLSPLGRRMWRKGRQMVEASDNVS